MYWFVETITSRQLIESFPDPVKLRLHRETCALQVQDLEQAAALARLSSSAASADMAGALVSIR
jgi:hypothetical protein